MQFVIILSANPNLNSDRRENSRKCRRCQQYLAEQTYRVAVVAHRDAAHVPQYRPLRIEVGGADQQNAALNPLSGDFLKKRIVHIFCDQSRQRRIVGQRGSFEQTGHVVGENVLSPVLRKYLTQLIVMIAPEKGKRSNERARADAGNQIEHWPRARIAPAHQQAAPKAPSSAPPDIARRFETSRCLSTPNDDRVCPSGRIRHHDRLDLPGRCVTPKADVMKSIELDLAGICLRQDIARGNRCASSGQKDSETDKSKPSRTPHQPAKVIALLFVSRLQGTGD